MLRLLCGAVALATSAGRLWSSEEDLANSVALRDDSTRALVARAAKLADGKQDDDYVPPKYELQTRPWYDKYNPLGFRDATKTLADGKVRLTVITPGVMRLEYSADGVFDDRPSLAFLNRAARISHFNETTEGTKFTLETPLLRVTFDSDPSLGVGLTSANAKFQLRTPPYSEFNLASPRTGNLHGTIRTLDRVGDPIDLACPPVTNFYVYYCHCEEGLISKDGWVVVDDSLRPRMEFNHENSGVPWPISPNVAALKGDGSYQDFYIFGHGRDYAQTFKDFREISGPVPLMPRHALGPAFSRWFAWNDLENIAIVQQGFAENGIPLDIHVVDMDWHESYPRGLPNNRFPGQKIDGWTGLTVNPLMFPEPLAFANYLNRRGVKLMFNHHHAAGVQHFEERYLEFAAAVGGVDTSVGQAVEFDISNRTWTDLYFKHVIRPLDDVGVNLDWEDYQQQPVTRVPLLNPTIMINHAWYTNPHRYSLNHGPSRNKALERPFVMGRFGGLGAHRYPIGFVGDTHVKWEVLRYETYFMPTSSNVMFQWTHDIGGFEGPSPPEFFTRHVQFGTFSSQLRTHSSKRSPARAIWNYPQPYFATMKRFYRLRARLVPYIATMQRRAFVDGVPLIRPLYHDFPWAEPFVYQDQALHQYSFGDAMWLAPISEPAPAPLNFATIKKMLRENADGSSVPASYFNVSGAAVTPWTFWAPPGKWIEWFSWEAFESPTEPSEPKWQEYADESKRSHQLEDNADRMTSEELHHPAGKGAFFSRHYAIGEMPLFSRPGTIIPMRTLPANGGGVIGISAQVPTALTFMVLGGVDIGQPGGLLTTTAHLYDDDGVTVLYDGDADKNQGGKFYTTPVKCTWKRANATATGGDDEGKGIVALDENGEVKVENAEGAASSGNTGELAYRDNVQCNIQKPLGLGFPEMPERRTYTFRFVGMLPPEAVVINEKEFAVNDQEAMPDANGENPEWQKGVYSWAYDGATSSTWVHVGVRQEIQAGFAIRLVWAKGVSMSDPVVSKAGVARKLSRAIACKEEVDALYGAIFPSDVESLLSVTASISRMRAAPNALDALFVRKTLTEMDRHLKEAVESMQQWRIPPNHKLKMPQLRCINSVRDALAGFTPLKEDDPRVVKATQQPKFKYTAGEHLTVPDPILEGLSPLASADDGAV